MPISSSNLTAAAKLYLKQDEASRCDVNTGTYRLLLHIMCGYQCDKAVNKNDTREVI